EFGAAGGAHDLADPDRDQGGGDGAREVGRGGHGRGSFRTASTAARCRSHQGTRAGRAATRASNESATSGHNTSSIPSTGTSRSRVTSSVSSPAVASPHARSRDG